MPNLPKSFEEAGIEEALVEQLVIKVLYNAPGTSGGDIAAMIGLYADPVRRLLGDLKGQNLVVHRGSTGFGDFRYQLSELGRRYAEELRNMSRYASIAPVPVQSYRDSVAAQSIQKETPSMEDLARAFSDLEIPDHLLQKLGPAMASGRAMFLYGEPGNGKTSIAERATAAYGKLVFLPHSILVGGTIIKVYDPQVHERIPENQLPDWAERTDPRWVLCKRPTVVVGGELTMNELEMSYSQELGIGEAPIQVKANCGILLIDDFGRQRVDPTDLLNRWIFPLEKRIDYMQMPDGSKVALPFDPLLMLATNLDPEDLVDEAFLRRIPYKINVEDPSEKVFRIILDVMAKKIGFLPDTEIFDYLIDDYYKKTGRSFRGCHPRDLLTQVRDQCAFRRTPFELTREGIDEACDNYFIDLEGSDPAAHRKKT